RASGAAARRSGAVQDGVQGRHVSGETGDTLMTTTLRALIVDDEALARMRMRTLLSDCTAPAASVVAAAAHAVQAMDALRREVLGVVSLGIHMPAADGITRAETIAQLPRPRAVVFVTAHSEHAVQAFELEAVDYLTKPVRLERLQQALQKVERLLQAGKGLQPDFDEECLIIQDRGRDRKSVV